MSKKKPQKKLRIRNVTKYKLDEKIDKYICFEEENKQLTKHVL